MAMGPSCSSNTIPRPDNGHTGQPGAVGAGGRRCVSITVLARETTDRPVVPRLDGPRNTRHSSSPVITPVITPDRAGPRGITPRTITPRDITPGQACSTSTVGTAVLPAASATSESVSTPTAGVTALPCRRRPIQARSGPQIPVEYQLGNFNVLRNFAEFLDPEAPSFIPTGHTGPPSGMVLPVDVISELVSSVSTSVLRRPAPAAAPVPCRCHQLPVGSCPSFITDYIEIVQLVQSHPSGLCNIDGARVPLRHRPIDPGPWNHLLVGYYDRHNLVEALTYGWDLSFTGTPEPRDAPSNHPSALQQAAAVDEYVQAELAHGSLVGPLPADIPFPVFRSPLATVPKPPDKWRTITDCSQNDAGINFWIPADVHRGKAATITLPGTPEICVAIKKIQVMYPGQVVVLFKGDYGRYYRQFLVCPSQSPFLAVGWRDEKYADRSWSFGNRGACGGAQRFSSAVSWFFRTKVPPRPGAINSGINCQCPGPCHCGCNQMEPYVDDSIGVVPKIHATFLFNSFLELVDRLGLQLSATPGHVTPPATAVVALGLLYDTESNTVSLPADKLSSILEMLAEWRVKSSATPKELATFAGRLLWVCNVVPPGRVFLGRVLATKRYADSCDRRIKLDEDFKHDVEWWQSMVTPWNGRSFLVPIQSADVSLDASSDGWLDGGPGIGGYNFVTHQFFATGVPPSMATWYIGNLELFAVIIAMSIWGEEWGGHSVHLLTDNEGVRFLLQNGRSRDTLRLHMARSIVGRQFCGNYRIETSRISTEQNTLADALSRLGSPAMWPRFSEICSNNNVVPRRIAVPAEIFLPENW